MVQAATKSKYVDLLKSLQSKQKDKITILLLGIARSCENIALKLRQKATIGAILNRIQCLLTSLTQRPIKSVCLSEFFDLARKRRNCLVKGIAG